MAKRKTDGYGNYIADAEDLDIILGSLPPIRGTWYFVDPTSGLAANSGLTPGGAKASIEEAYALCISGAGDGIVIISAGTASAGTTSYLSDTITWSKHGITVVGLCAGGFYNQRARISTAETDLVDLINLTGANNRFFNVSLYNGADISNAQMAALKLAGVRNAFINCDFKASPATASAYKSDLWLSGAHENFFLDCNFGNASYDAGNHAACHIYMDGTTGNGQNFFRNCTMIAQVSAGTAFGGLKIGAAAALNGAMIFDNLIAAAWRANVNKLDLASWFIGTKPTTGIVVVKNSGLGGYAVWDAEAGNDFINVIGATDAAPAGIGALP